jgi:hypothetical protein
MKKEIFTLFFLTLTTFLAAQAVDTLVNSSKVQKKIFIVRKNDAKESFKSYEALKADINLQKSDAEHSKKIYKSLPKMVSDKDGLLNQAFLQYTDDAVSTNFTDPFAIMSITISELGFISKIVVHDYSSRELVEILLKKFEYTHWKAAKDSNGKNAAYTYHKIAVIMPIVIKPAERED